MPSIFKHLLSFFFPSSEVPYGAQYWEVKPGNRPYSLNKRPEGKEARWLNFLISASVGMRMEVVRVCILEWAPSKNQAISSILWMSLRIKEEIFVWLHSLLLGFWGLGCCPSGFPSCSLSCFRTPLTDILPSPLVLREYSAVGTTLTNVLPLSSIQKTG